MDTRSVLLFISLLPGLISSGSPCSDFTGLVAASPCSSYFISCRHGVESRVNCSHGLIFNPEKSQCDFKENIQSCKGQFSCTRGDGHFGVGCSEVYWLCRNGIPSQQVCPNGLFFNEVDFSCDLKMGVPACGGVSRRIANSSKHSSESLPTLRPLKSRSLDCHNFSHKKSALSLCNANYIECSKGVLSVGVCPSGSLFDSDRSSCVDVNQLNYCVHVIPKITTMSPLENECSDLEDGVYSTGCSETFFTCTHKTQHVFNCPSDLIYNEALELCDYPDSVQSCQGREANPVEKKTVKKAPLKNKIEDIWEFNEVPAKDKQRKIDCSSHPDGYYSSGCVSEYVSCIGGEAQKYSCGNLVFNSVGGICDYPDHCIKTLPNRHSISTSVSNDFPNAFDCSKLNKGIYSTGCVSSFTSCSEGLPLYGRCPEGLVYNQHAGFCDYVESCVKSDLKGKDAPDTLHSNLEAEIIDCLVREDGFYSTKKCSPDFVACSNGRSQQRRCPDLLLFVDDLGYCDYPSVECDAMLGFKTTDHLLNQKDQPQNHLNQNVPLLVNKTHECITDGLFEMGCSSTYVSCSNGLSTHVTCPNNLVFNPSSKLCDYSCDIGPKHDVPVFDNSVNGINTPVFDSQKCVKDGPLPGQTCLDSFYVCFHGYRVLQNCPSSLVFSDHTQRCEYPELCHALTQTATGAPTASQINRDHKRPITYSSTTRTPLVYSSTIKPNDNHGFSKQGFDNGNTNEFSCLHRKDGRYSIGGCYGMYALCVSGRLSVQNCPDGLVFDTLTLSCGKQCMSGQHDVPHVANTPQNVESENICLRGKRFALGQCKSAFLECSSGQQIFKECPSGTTFDIKYGLCIYDAANCKTTDAAPVVPIYNQAGFTEPQRPAICQVGVSYPRGDCENSYLRCVDGYSFEQLACFQNKRFDPISLECRDIILITSCVHHASSVQAPVQSTPIFSDPMFLDDLHYGFRRHRSHRRHDSHSEEKWVRDGFQGDAQRHGRIISNPFYQGRKYAHRDHHHRHHNRGHDHKHRHRDVAYDHVRPHHRRHSIRLLDSFDGPRLRHMPISNPFYDKRHGKSRRVSVDDVFKRLRFPITDSIYTIFPSSRHRGHHRRHHRRHHQRHGNRHIMNHKNGQVDPELFEGSGNNDFDQTEDTHWKGSGFFNDVSEEMEGSREEPNGNWRRKRYADVSPSSDSVLDVCQPGNAKQAVAVGYCQQNFVFCTDELQQLVAACPVGESFDSVRKFCSDNCGTTPSSVPQHSAPVGSQPHAPITVFEQNEALPYAPQVVNIPVQPIQYAPLPAHLDPDLLPVYQQPYESEALDGYNTVPLSRPQFVPGQAVPYVPQPMTTRVHLADSQRHTIQSDRTFQHVSQQQHEPENSLGAEDIKYGYMGRDAAQPPQTVSSDSLFTNHLSPPAVNTRLIPEQQYSQQKLETESHQQKSNINIQNFALFAQGLAQTKDGFFEADTGCATRPDGIFALGCSSTFVTCVGGISYVSSCPTGLVFDEAFLACNIPEAAFCNNGVSNSVPVDQSFFQQSADFGSNIFIPAQVAHAQQEQDVFDASANSQYENFVVHQEQDVFDTSANSQHENSIVHQDNEERQSQFVPEFETLHSSVEYEDIFQGSHIGHEASDQVMNAYSNGEQFGETYAHGRRIVHNKNVGIENRNLRPMFQKFNATHVIVIDPATPIDVVTYPLRFHDAGDSTFVLNNDHRIPNWVNSGPVTSDHNDEYFYKEHSVPSFPNFKPEQIYTNFSVPTRASIGDAHQSFVHQQDLNQQQAVHEGSSNTNFSSSSKDSVRVIYPLNENSYGSSATSQIGASEPILSCSARIDGGYFLNCDGGFIMCVSGQMHLVKCAGSTNFNETTQKCEYVVDKCKSVPGSTIDPYTPTVFKKHFVDSMEKETPDETYHPVASPIDDLVPVIEHKPFLRQDSLQRFSHAQDTKPYTSMEKETPDERYRPVPSPVDHLVPVAEHEPFSRQDSPQRFSHGQDTKPYTSMEKETHDERYRPVPSPVDHLVPVTEYEPFSRQDSPQRFSHAQDTKPYTPHVVSVNQVIEQGDATDTKSADSILSNFEHTNFEVPTSDSSFHPYPTVLPYRPSVTGLPYRPSVTGLPGPLSVRNEVANEEPTYTNIPGDIPEETYSPKLMSEIVEQEEVITKVSSYCSKQNVAVGDVCASFFYVCSYGVVKKMLCSSGEVFNPSSASCDLISNIPECNDGSYHSLVVSSEGSLQVDHEDNQEEIGTPSNIPVHVSTERAQTTKYTTSAVDVTKVSGIVEETTLAALRSESGMPCDSEKDSVFPIAQCHITYAVCESTGFARAANCTPTYLFDHALLKCVPSEECGNLQIKEFLAALHSNSDSVNEVCEDAEGNEMRALRECGRSYAVCGTPPSVERCPNKFIFDQSKQKCIAREDVAACRTNEKILPKTATVTQTTIHTSHNDRVDVVQFCALKNDGYYRSPEKCTGVVQCFNGEMIEHSPCPSGLVFNNILKYCDYPVNIPECSEEMAHSNEEDSCVHGAHIADDKDCSIYYRCVWNRKIKMDCPETTVFNPKLAVCDYIDAVPQCNSHNIDILDSGPKLKITDTVSHSE